MRRRLALIVAQLITFGNAEQTLEIRHALEAGKPTIVTASDLALVARVEVIEAFLSALLGRPVRLG